MKKSKNRSIHLSVMTICATSLTVVAAVAVSVFLFIAVYNATLLRDASTNSEQTVKQTATTVSNYIMSLEENISLVCREISSSSSSEEVTSRITIAARLHEDIAAILVYDMDGNLLVYSSYDGKLKNDITNDLSFNEELMSESSDFIISRPHIETLFEGLYPWVVTIVHKEYQELFGGDVYVAIDFRFSQIAKYIDHVGIGQHGYCFIIDQNGSVVYHPQQQMIFSGLKDENIDEISLLEDGVHVEDGVIHSIKSLPGCRWRIVGKSYTDELIISRNRTIGWVILLSLLCCAALSVVIQTISLKIITKPVRRLVRAMQDFELNADTYRYHSEKERVAELKLLSDSFEHMVGMVQNLMERVRKEEITLRKTELKALQAQINPHFLYNTLDSIQWMCEQDKTEDAVKMVGALARLFRISISRGREFITIRDELKHAKSYLLIQSYRYKNQFSYSFEVDEELEECLCNKITIQPLLENAIYHGIDRMVDEGVITIKVRKAPEGDDILIEVEDNGVGMTEEQCRSILQKEKSDSSGIGIKNVNDRLRIYFGDKYGLSITSEPDVGTKITIRLPQIWDENDIKN